jgi:hypothetical protein
LVPWQSTGKMLVINYYYRLENNKQNVKIAKEKKRMMFSGATSQDPIGAHKSPYASFSGELVPAEFGLWPKPAPAERLRPWLVAVFRVVYVVVLEPRAPPPEKVFPVGRRATLGVGPFLGRCSHGLRPCRLSRGWGGGEGHGRCLWWIFCCFRSRDEPGLCISLSKGKLGRRKKSRDTS